MAKVGVTLDYKRKFQRILFWYITNLVTALILTVLTFVTYIQYQSSNDLYVVKFLCSCVFQHFMMATMLTTYCVFIFNVYQRFNILNSMLRWVFRTEKKLKFYIFSNIILISYRMKFCSQNLKKKLAQSKEEYVAFIKFTGRLHELLTEIMENIDKCYSLQVTWLFYFKKWLTIFFEN